MANYHARTEVEMLGFYLQLHDFSLQTVNLILWLSQRAGRCNPSVLLRAFMRLWLWWEVALIPTSCNKPWHIKISAHLWRKAVVFFYHHPVQQWAIVAHKSQVKIIYVNIATESVKVRKIFIPQTWQDWIAVQNGVQMNFSLKKYTPFQ